MSLQVSVLFSVLLLWNSQSDTAPAAMDICGVERDSLVSTDDVPDNEIRAVTRPSVSFNPAIGVTAGKIESSSPAVGLLIMMCDLRVRAEQSRSLFYVCSTCRACGNASCRRVWVMS